MFYFLWPLSDDKTNTYRSISKLQCQFYCLFYDIFYFHKFVKGHLYIVGRYPILALNFYKKKKGLWSICLSNTKELKRADIRL